MKRYIKCLSIVLAAVLLLLCGMPYVSADQDSSAIDDGYAVVTDFGADGSDTKDDYEAFKAALATGKNIYVPNGNYYVSETIKLTDRIIRGSDPGGTVIYGTMKDKNAPIILAEGVSSVYDMKIAYKTKAECVGATTGEKVGIQLGSAEKALMPGSVIRSIFFVDVGTAVYNPADAGCNGVLMENLQIYQLYRGVDMQGENRVGNSYSNVYANYHDSKNAIVVDCGFALEGSSYGETIHQLNIEHNSYETACVILKNAKNVNISAMHFEGVNLANNNTGYIYCENTSGYIGGLSIFFTYVNTYKNSMIRFGDSNGQENLIIDILENRGLNGPDPGQHADWCTELLEERGLDRGLIMGGDTAADFVLFRRASGAKGEYNVRINYYSYYTIIGGDGDRYLDYMEKGDNINFSIKNEPEEVTK